MNYLNYHLNCLIINVILTSHEAFRNSFLTIKNLVRITVINTGNFFFSLHVYNSLLRLSYSKIVYLKTILGESEWFWKHFYACDCTFLKYYKYRLCLQALFNFICINYLDVSFIKKNWVIMKIVFNYWAYKCISLKTLQCINSVIDFIKWVHFGLTRGSLKG